MIWFKRHSPFLFLCTQLATALLAHTHSSAIGNSRSSISPETTIKINCTVSSRLSYSSLPLTSTSLHSSQSFVHLYHVTLIYLLSSYLPTYLHVTRLDSR